MRIRFVTCPFLAIFFLTLVACGQSEPKLVYQNDKTTLVISLDSRLTGGPPFIGEFCNHLPDLRVWGDGRIVFSQNTSGQHRIVRTGNLDKSQVQSLLELVDKSGFFNPNTPEVPNPAAIGYHLTVMLKSGTFDYNWTLQPTIYSKLIKAVEGYDFAEFTPERALLVSSPYYINSPLIRDQLPMWPSHFGFLLAKADKGTWINGEMLVFLWQSVNNSQFIIPGFQEDNQFYSIALEIPAISMQDPPFDCWGSEKTILP